jgi:hypothetical protein
MAAQIVDPAVAREYIEAFHRLPDETGAQFWTTALHSGQISLSQLSVIFANSPEFAAHYSGATATTPASIALVQEFYSPGLERNAPPATDPGVQYWVHSGLDAAQLLEAFSQSPQFTEEMQPQITIFQNAEITGTLGVLAGLPYPEYL